MIKSDFNRRRFLELAAGSFLGVTASNCFGAAGEKSAIPPLADPSKQLIYLYMEGGMSHIDTFDLKTNHDNQGSTKPINSNVDGIRVSSHLPNLARHADKLCIVNSLTSTAGDHEKGNYFMHTSYQQRATIRHPGIGSWYHKLKGKLNPTLPASVFIGRESRFHGSGGFFEPEFEPLAINEPESGLKYAKALVEKNRFDRRIKLANDIDAEFLSRYHSKPVRAYGHMYADAVRLMDSPDLAAFNIHEENIKTQQRYGTEPFGQGCLLARRLVERDVRTVEVSFGGWDTHQNNFTSLPELCHTMDQAVAALLDDLERIGKLKDTVVVLTTEFGRTPQINQNVGRDHYPQAFTSVLAGGGFKGGYVHGKTSEGAEEVIDGLMTIPDFNASIAYALGIPVDYVLYSPTVRPFTVAHKGKPQMELLS
ncbi:MAG: hypothetical protein CMI27_00560 [Opitutae bacterium]|nr:hypothetical protein [Opitutae bacterium]|tara:strand:- start:244 stop:1512 length:1269 start_codon:yes stop_codon:yes gene_type:complete